MAQQYLGTNICVGTLDEYFNKKRLLKFLKYVTFEMYINNSEQKEHDAS